MCRLSPRRDFHDNVKRRWHVTQHGPEAAQSAAGGFARGGPRPVPHSRRIRLLALRSVLVEDCLGGRLASYLHLTVDGGYGTAR